VAGRDTAGGAIGVAIRPGDANGGATGVGVPGAPTDGVGDVGDGSSVAAAGRGRGLAGAWNAGTG
jgi:hypothetical protein